MVVGVNHLDAIFALQQVILLRRNKARDGYSVVFPRRLTARHDAASVPDGFT